MGKTIAEVRMAKTIPVTFPDQVLAQVDELSRVDGVSSSDLILEAVEEYLSSRRLRELRARVVPQARAQGFVTDEDVFRAVS